MFVFDDYGKVPESIWEDELPRDSLLNTNRRQSDNSDIKKTREKGKL